MARISDVRPIGEDAEELVRVTIESYDAAAESFHDRYYDRLHLNRSIMLGLVMFVRELVARGDPRAVLDVGCGPGEHAEFIARTTSASVIGVDRSWGMLRVARRRSEHVSVARMDARQIAFPAETFDGILASNVVHHLPRAQVAGFFTELRRVARPGCTLYVITKEGTSDSLLEGTRDAGLTMGPRYVSSFTRDELNEYAATAGFTVHRSFTPEGGYVHLLAALPAVE